MPPIILDTMQQGSLEWLKERVGNITMSNASSLLANGKGEKESVTKLGYYSDVASEVLSGVSADRINTWGMERGTLLEPFARKAYERVTGKKVQEVGLGYLDENRRISASPDGLCLGEGKGLEIKCRGAKAHLRTIINGHDAADVIKQIQGNMWVFGVREWDYCSFCPEFAPLPLFIHTVHRDEAMIARINEEAHKAVVEVDKIVSTIRQFGHNNVQDICDEALLTLEINQGGEGAGIY